MPTDAAKDAQASPAAAEAAAIDDLETARKAVEDTAAIGGGLWLSYLFVLFYLGIAAGAVTHTDLFLKNPVKLPFLNIELPLLAFFFLAPLLLLLTHAYTLVHLVLLARRVEQFNAIKGLSEAWRRRLPSNIFVQFLGAPEEDRYGAFGLLLGFILRGTLVVAPIALYLLLEIKFLPYHSWWITSWIRIVLFFDLGFLWWLWRGEILASRAPRRRAPVWKTVVTWTPGALVLLFAWFVATIPGEWGKTTPIGWGIGNTLYLPEFNVYEALKIDDPQKVAWKQYLIDLNGRDLREAMLFRAILTKADLRFAQLQGASLYDARLQGASLDGAQLQGAQLFRTQLQGASLRDAQLQGTTLDGVQLQGASLDRAQLQGTTLGGVQLQGTSLDYAQLQGASLYDVQLQGASLDGAQLQGALLVRAQLQGASLGVGAQLQGASLDHAQLQGASLDYAQLQGASLEKAKLQGASLQGAFLWRAQLNDPVVEAIVAPTGLLQNWAPEYAGLRSPANPEAWTVASYAELRRSIEREVPEGEARKNALKRVAILDCARKGDTLDSCDASADVPDAVKKWQKTIEAAGVDQIVYAKALSAILGNLVCSNEGDRIYVLRGLLRSGRFLDTGAEMPALAKRITSPECPVSTALTDDDKTLIALVSRRAAASSKSP